MATIELWGRRSAFNVQKALWALGELRLDFVHHDAGGAVGGLDTPGFLAMNPHGRVPVLVDSQGSIWESHSILRYLGAQYGDGALWPEAPAARSRADRWMDWAQTSLQPDFMKLFWGYYRTPESERNEHRIAAAARACDEHFRTLDAHLASQLFLGGDAFTLGDIPAATSLYRYFEMGLDVPRHGHVDAWYARLRDRPAFRDNVMVPFDALRGRLAF